MISPLFEFFEIIADELCSDSSRVITRFALQSIKEVSTLLDDLQLELSVSSAEQAIQEAVLRLEAHFRARGSQLPFTYEAITGRFEATDIEFLEFVREMNSIRSIGKRSKTFECQIATRLTKRATGSIHRIGHPRVKHKKKKEFNKYLRALGFRRPVLLGNDKDGGLDIIWVLPIGAVPHQPLVSVQCKNGTFDSDEGDKSVGAGSRSLAMHGGLQPGVHVMCVLFNDYIQTETLARKPFNFVPLGLTDLATASTAVYVEMI